MASNAIMQIAYKDKTGNTRYQSITTSTKLINRAYLNSGTKNVNYSIPTSDANKTYSFENLSVNDSSWKKTTAKAVSKLPKGDVSKVNPNQYPKLKATDTLTGRKIYDYTAVVQSDIMKSIQSIKRDLNVPSAYNRLELNKLFRTKFNRFRIAYPDYFLNNTLGFVVFTRPDLNLMNGDNLHSQVSNDPQLYYIAKADLDIVKSLTRGYSSAHHFHPLLSNTLTSIDVADESIDTLETGETFTGFKTQYAKSNIRSMTAGTITLSFPETYNMGLTHLHQLWCAYESGVYRGSLRPKDEYIWGKELDYACDIYYFVLDVEDLIIRYWCKYTGCFPLNVNKSIFSYNVDTQISHPNLSVTYAYFAREDMSLANLHEFNNNAGGNVTRFKYKANYIPDIGGVGNTWSGPPFIQQITVPSGLSRDATLYALRFKTD